MEKKQWQLRYEHDREVQAAWCESVGKPIPVVEEQYGVLKRTENYWRKFQGKTFWPALNKRGHTKVEFCQCACYK